jgi:copper chaperone CopZ
MPLEAMSCTGCGSTDVQEVKPSTYFCNHCETVFKHVDPSRVAVSHTPGFCECGSGRPVTAQCQVCRSTELCEDCDFVWVKNPFMPPKFMMHTVGFGYVSHNLRSVHSEWPGFRLEGTGYIVYGGRASQENRDDDLAIYRDSLLAALRQRTGARRLQHVCVPCLASAVPHASERIANGTECVWFDCARPGEQCRGCGRTFCSLHRTNAAGEYDLNPSSTDDEVWRHDANAIARSANTLSIVKVNDKGPKKEPQNPAAMQRWEKRIKTPKMTCHECRDKIYERLARAYGDTGTVEVERKRTEKQQVKENERARLEGERRWNELNGYAKWLAASGAFRADPDTVFAIVDNRASTPAAAAPNVLGS